MNMSTCLALAEAITESDRDELLARVDGLIESGVPPAKAQVMASNDMLAEIGAEREELVGLIKQQHADLWEGQPTRPARRRQDSTRATVSAGRIRTSIAEMVEQAKSMSSWRDWFERHVATIEEMFGPDAELFKKILAATSQAATVPANVALALKAYRQHYAGVEFTGFLPAVARNLERIRGDADVRGLKISEYDKANRGDPQGMAVDRHIAQLMFRTNRPNRRQIRSAHDRIKAIAEKLGWQPREVQSALWAYNQVRKGRNPDDVETYEDRLRARQYEIASYRLLADDARGRIGGVRGPSPAGGIRDGRQSAQDRARTRDERGVEYTGIEAAGVDDLRYSERQPLYVSRNVVNGRDILDWAAKQGFTSTLPAEELHVTVAFSREPVGGVAPETGTMVDLGGKRVVKRLGDEGAIVLGFENDALQAGWSRYKDAGASWDYESYQPHITITYDGAGVDLESVEPYSGPIVLGGEKQEPLDLDKKAELLATEESPKLSRRTGRFELREFGRGAKIIEAIQDRYNRWKQAIADIKKQGGSVSEDNDFYRAEERYWGKVGAQIEDFGEQVRQFVRDVHEDGLTVDAVARYAYAQHAEERNKHIAAKRPGMPDGGSGISTADAQNELLNAQLSGNEPDLRKHAATLRSWAQGTRDVLFNEGLISQDEYDNWNQMFQFYVPLRGLPDDTDLPTSQKRGIGQGFDIKGKESKEAKGRMSEAKEIVENIISDRSRAYIRAGKNDVLRHFLKFVLDNPSPNLWEVEAVENKPTSTIDANGDRIIEDRQVIVKDDRTVAVKDGGREIHIVVRDEKLREQLKNLNAETVAAWVGALLFVNRMLSRLYTSLSPVFTVVNLIRDVQTATFGAINELGFIGAARMWANMPAALKESAQAEMGNRSADYNLFRSTGGKTGFFDFKSIDDLTKELTLYAAQSEMSALDPRKAAPALLDLIESVNSALENTSRLAAFKTARQSGMSVAEAARVSKNLTVNFNRKGALTPGLSALFLFFNPAVQGTTQMLSALSNPKVIGTLGAAMGGMFGLAMQNASMGDDDDGIAWWDKVPSEVKERNIVIILPPGASDGDLVPGSKVGRYVKVPMPYGYNFFAVVANQLADLIRNSNDPRDGRGAAEAMAQAAGAFMGSWVPVPELGTALKGDAESAVLAFVPDALGPVAQSWLNRNPFGRELYPESGENRYLPDSTKYFASQAGSIFQKGAQLLNRAAGGTDYEPPPWPLSIADMAPGTLENIVRGYGGGPASFGLDILNAMYARYAMERPEIDVQKLPFIKQFRGVIDNETDRMVGYANMEKATEVVSRIKAARDNGSDEAGKMIDENGPIYSLGESLKTTRERMAQLRKRELKIVTDEDMPDKQKVVELQLLNADRRAILQGFNESYGAALEELRKEQAAKQK